ncbi:RHS repeat-associated core domain-containing protein [Longispora sp. K20-0274]|uniref:RHS repeat-associated core domain-containing protein n=1 Tax=Longispora sp. K20-0274 TaxID=3088255 RepID=UPI00399B95D1
MSASTFRLCCVPRAIRGLFVRRSSLLSAVMLGLVAGLLPTVPALAAPGTGAPDLNEYVTPTSAAPGNGRAGTGMAGRLKAPKPVSWPAAGAAEVDLAQPMAKGLAAGPSGLAAGGPPGLVKAGALPVRVGAAASVAGAAPADNEKQFRSAASSAPGRVRVEILDRAGAAKAVKSGVALKVVRADNGASEGRTAVEFDYSGFAEAYGANYGSRLQIVQLPPCAAVTPDKPECKVQTPVRTVNDPVRKTVTADVSVAPTVSGATLGRSAPSLAATSAAAPVFALQATAAGPNGDFRRTPLQESATWQAGESGGGFSWNYPMRVPQSSGGLNPTVAASYSSAAVDGRTMAANGQAGILGEGWDLTAGGFVERRYAQCSEDGNQTGDLCWKNDNVTISLGGKTLRAFNDGSQETGWHVENDPGWRVTQCWGTLCGAQPDNGTFNGEYWIITTPDGTRYYFGSNHRLATQGVETESTLAVPVYSNNPGEPCYNGAGFAASACKMGWRWGLDYVQDTRDNSMTYFYEREWERYGQNLNATAAPYDRSNTLTRIEYGTRAGSENGSPAPYVIDFGLSFRCLEPGQPSCDESRFDQWPDSPFDQVCEYTASSCPGVYSPVFFTIRALSSVTMRVRDAAGTGYRDIERFDTPTGFWPMADGTAPALWLNNIGHTGLAGATPITMPNIVFYGTQLANRVDGTPTMNHYRMGRIVKETGAETLIDYMPAECTSMPNNVDNNGRCFLLLAKPNMTDPVDWTWWYKYVVAKVTEKDTAAGGSPDAVTSYDYSTAGASTTDGHPVTLWAFNQSSFQTSYVNRTWSDWRGYPTVTVTRDSGTGPKSVVKKLYMRGLDGDRIANDQSTIRHVKMTNSEGTIIDDWSVLRGQLWEEQTLDGTNAATRTIHDWDARQLAGQPLPYAGEIGWAFRIREKLARTHTRLGSGADRVTEVTTAFDTDGFPVLSVDKGEVTVTNNGATVTDVDTADTACASTTYNRNYTKFILVTVSQVEIQACPAGTPTGAVLSGSRTYYDGSGAIATAPTQGLATRVDTLSGNAPATYTTTSKTTYDALGRPTKTYDGLDHASTVGYTPVGAGPVTQVVMTNALGHVTTSTVDPAWGLPVAVVDPNNKTTQATYDAMGRLLKVWEPGRNTSQTANVAYEYVVTDNAAPYVKTSRIIPNGSTTASYEIYDARLRLRQTQAPTQDAKTVVIDTSYDSRDQVAATSAFKAAGAPSGVRLAFAAVDVHSRHTFTYDNLGRRTKDTLTGLDRNNTQVATGLVTSTAYAGDSVTVTPPAGGIATTEYLDARGRKTKLRQYKGATVSGSFLDSSFSYDILGRLTTTTDAGGNAWTAGYDVRSQVTSKGDPDAGTAALTYDNAGQLLTTTDARGVKLAFEYDSLGRKTGVVFKGTPSDKKMASWTYDTLAKGQPTSSTRYDGTDSYTKAVTGYDDGYRPLGTSITIPSSAGTLAGVYNTTSTYKVDGSPATVAYPAGGGLSAETVTFGYNSIGQQINATGVDSYLANATYFYDGGLYQSVRGAAGKQVKETTFREEYTGRLTKAQVDTERAGAQGTFDEQFNEIYAYDAAGNVLGVNENKAGVVLSNQCFGYDGLRRMTQAWTTTATNCQATPSAGVVGGVDPYWTSYTFDNSGGRATEIKHSVSGGTVTADTTRTYTSPAAMSVRPHSLTKIDTKVGAGSTSTTDQFTYDNVGNTATHNGATYSWNELGKLAAVTVSGGPTTTFAYDAEGDRVLRKDSTGTTVYLGGTELHANSATATPTATRAYPGAVRTTGGGLTWMVADHHGTSQTAIKPTDLSISRRRTDPYGGARGAAVAWPTEHGFVDGVNDPDTKLVHIGARDYDPAVGRFISVDPVFDNSDPQSWHGYAYAGNAPVTNSDATGLQLRRDDGGGDSSTPNGTILVISPPGVDSPDAVFYINGLGFEYGKTDVQQLASEIDSLIGQQFNGKLANDLTDAQLLRVIYTACISPTSKAHCSADMGLVESINAALTQEALAAAAESDARREAEDRKSEHDLFKGSNLYGAGSGYLAGPGQGGSRDGQGSGSGPVEDIYGPERGHVTGPYRAGKWARQLGYRPTGKQSSGDEIFEATKETPRKLPDSISRDNTAHNGGVYKGFDAKGVRIGTYKVHRVWNTEQGQFEARGLVRVGK